MIDDSHSANEVLRLAEALFRYQQIQAMCHKAAFLAQFVPSEYFGDTDEKWQFIHELEFEGIASFINNELVSQSRKLLVSIDLPTIYGSGSPYYASLCASVDELIKELKKITDAAPSEEF